MKLLVSDKGITLNLGPILTYGSMVKELKDLKQAFDFKQPVVLLGNDIAQIDTAGLQLLLIFLTSLKQEKISYMWEEPSPEIFRTAKLLGLTEILELPN